MILNLLLSSNHTQAPAPRPINPQAQSPLLTHLPAEIRNSIYTLAFAVLDSSIAQQKPSPHPLSLLLTCRRIHHEAHILAFTTYRFPLRHNLQPTYLGLKTATAHLSPLQLSAISSLSVIAGPYVTSLLTNALILFPNLARFAIKTRRLARHTCPDAPQSRQHADAPLRQTEEEEEAEDSAVDAALPFALYWFAQIIQEVMDGRAFAWQEGSQWRILWPHLRSEVYVQRGNDGAAFKLTMDDVTIRTNGRLHACICRRREETWTSAILVQEGGRRVYVEAVYCTEKGYLVQWERSADGIVLMPGAAPVRGDVVVGGAMGYEVDDEYWEALRRRNGDLGAICRHWWRRAAVTTATA